MSDMDVSNWYAWGVENMDGKGNITYFLQYGGKFKNCGVLYLLHPFMCWVFNIMLQIL